MTMYRLVRRRVEDDPRYLVAVDEYRCSYSQQPWTVFPGDATRFDEVEAVAALLVASEDEGFAFWLERLDVVRAHALAGRKLRQRRRR